MVSFRRRPFFYLVGKRMRVRVKCFAWAKEVTGEDEIDLEVPDSATVNDLRESLSARFPVFSGRMESIAVSVNHEFAGEGTPVEADDELALIPPISGGVA